MILLSVTACVIFSLLIALSAVRSAGQADKYYVEAYEYWLKTETKSQRAA
jgi:hypothetical protein